MNNPQRNSGIDSNNMATASVTTNNNNEIENAHTNGILENNESNRHSVNLETSSELANDHVDQVGPNFNIPYDEIDNQGEEPRTPPPTGPPLCPPTPLITPRPDPDIQIPTQTLPPTPEADEDAQHHGVLPHIFSPVSRFMPLVFLLIYHLPIYVVVASIYLFNGASRLFVALLFILKIFIFMG